MKTYRITEKDIEGMTPVAVGYKIFNHDYSTKSGNYDYKDENGNVVGTIHKVDGDISECRWGLHFSKLPHDCFNFYESVHWNKFAKVEAYDKLIEGEQKCVTNILKIVQTFTFDEFIKLIRKELQNNGSYGINESYGINGSNGINRSNGINWSYGINRSNGINWSYGIIKCEGVSRSIFCFGKSGKLMVFNEKVTESRFNEIMNNIRRFRWSPKFNNAEELKGNLAWYETNIPAIVRVDNKTAWSFMPEDMKSYIQSLPEYNAEIFEKIIGDIEE